MSHRAQLYRVEHAPGSPAVREGALRGQHETQHIHDDQQHDQSLQDHTGLVVRLEQVVQAPSERRCRRNNPAYCKKQYITQ